MNYDRSFKSEMNNDRGQLFEKMILLGYGHYKKKGLAVAEKTPEPFSVKKKMVNDAFTGRFYKSKKAQPDFQGTLAGGRSIIFEAETTQGDRIKQSAISTTQSDCSRMHTELGVCTGVCVQVRKTYAFIPFSIWDDMKILCGRKYMTEEELKEYETATLGFIGFLNYVGEV